MTKTRTGILCVLSAVIPVVALYFGGMFPEKTASPLAVVVSGPKTANVGEFVPYQAKLNSNPWGLSQVVYQWKVLQDGKQVPYMNQSDGSILLSSVPGKYYVVTSATAYYNWFLWHDVVPLGVIVNETVIGTPTPEPTPTPTPAPVPTPGPLAGKGFWAIGVLDFTKLASLPALQYSLFSSTTVRPSVIALGGEWLKYDVNDPKQQNTEWMQAAKKYGAPALVVVNTAGTVVSTTALPGNESDLVNFIQKLKGGTR